MPAKGWPFTTRAKSWEASAACVSAALTATVISVPAGVAPCASSFQETVPQFAPAAPPSWTALQEPWRAMKRWWW
jgi:hypothetical protein